MAIADCTACCLSTADAYTTVAAGLSAVAPTLFLLRDQHSTRELIHLRPEIAFA
ncbi:MAG: hypothetical protein MNPFHGCM_01926 [Gemmatimonadaceae bacterium]|nr:hypothetical protein [Gemmatimonadaceae bacterium]